METATRDEQIVALYRAGHSLRAVADASGVSHERVRQVLQEYGIKMRRGRVSPQRRIVIERKRAQARERAAQPPDYSRFVDSRALRRRLLKMRSQGMAVNEIAATAHIPAGAVTAILRSATQEELRATGVTDG